jgi:hypothetical protein
MSSVDRCPPVVAAPIGNAVEVMINAESAADDA